MCFFFNDPATTEIYTLSLHDALPISGRRRQARGLVGAVRRMPLSFLPILAMDALRAGPLTIARDRKSTRLNSSHANISYAVFCLKKKKNNISHEHKSRYNINPQLSDL